MNRSRGRFRQRGQPAWRLLCATAVGAAVALAFGTVAAKTQAQAQAQEDHAQGGAPEVVGPEPDAELARSLFRMGIELSGQQRWSEAEDLFRRSYALVPRVSTAYNLTLVLLHLGRGREALDLLSELSRLADSAVAEYRDRLSAMRAHALELVGRVSLSVVPHSAELQLDGQPVPGGGGVRQLVVDPGSHEIHVAAPGFEPQTLPLTVNAGDRLTRSIHLDPEREAAVAHAERARGPSRAPATPPAGRADRDESHVRSDRNAATSSGVPWPAIAFLAGGGGLLAAGGVFGVLALNEDAAFVELCPDVTRCPAERRAELEPLAQRAADYGTAADVLFIGGAAAVAAGLGFLLFGQDDPHEQVGAWMSPASAGLSLRGSF